VFCNDAGAELGTPPVLFLGLGGLQLLRATITGAEVEIHCKDLYVEGKLELLGLGTATLTYLGCKLVKPANCKFRQRRKKKL
jgi:hypothetical protein